MAQHDRKLFVLVSRQSSERCSYILFYFLSLSLSLSLSSPLDEDWRVGDGKLRTGHQMTRICERCRGRFINCKLSWSSTDDTLFSFSVLTDPVWSNKRVASSSPGNGGYKARNEIIAGRNGLKKKTLRVIQYPKRFQWDFRVPRRANILSTL
jgi:hypothetical protein